MRKRRTISCVTSGLFLLIAACGGDIDRQVTSDDQENTAEKGDEIPSCSAAGLASECDPIGLTGCGEASCYLTKDVGTSCVCAAGSAELGDPCNTSVECAPSSVCAGKVAPGVCRAVCTAGECPEGMKCTVITGIEPFGYCEPE